MLHTMQFRRCVDVEVWAAATAATGACLRFGAVTRDRLRTEVLQRAATRDCLRCALVEAVAATTAAVFEPE